MKSILIIIPYSDIYPPMNGGMQRCFHILNQLGKYFEVTAIIHQDKESFLTAINEYPAIKNMSVHSTEDRKPFRDLFSFLPAKIGNGLRYRWLSKQLSKSADGSFLKYYPILISLLGKHHYDAIILENLNTINAVPVIRKFDKKVQIIYDAHNVDSILADGTINQTGIIKVESSLHKKVNAIFTCSTKDSDEFMKMNHQKLPVVVIPNGVVVSDQLLIDDSSIKEPESILFCGALWTQANQEGLLWFYYNIWRKVKESLPELKLLVVGSGTPPESFQTLLQDRSLQFTGTVNNVKPWYKKSAVAIVPLLSGSGTRLKILEAMSLGVPVVSTSKGAEGIEFTNGKNIFISDLEQEFANRIIALLKNRNLRVQIGIAARELVKEKYDWDIIGKSLNKFIYSQLQ